MVEISRTEYAALYGPTTGDQVRRDQVLALVALAEPTAHEASDTPS